MTAADLCRERWWEKDTPLQDGDMICRITHVGKRYVLVHWIAFRESPDLPWCRVDDWCVEEDFLLRSAVLRMTAIDRLPWEVPDADSLQSA